jgi:hypothetical protein
MDLPSRPQLLSGFAYNVSQIYTSIFLLCCNYRESFRRKERVFERFSNTVFEVIAFLNDRHFKIGKDFPIFVWNLFSLFLAIRPAEHDKVIDGISLTDYFVEVLFVRFFQNYFSFVSFPDKLLFDEFLSFIRSQYHCFFFSICGQDEISWVFLERTIEESFRFSKYLFFFNRGESSISNHKMYFCVISNEVEIEIG